MELFIIFLHYSSRIIYYIFELLHLQIIEIEVYLFLFILVIFSMLVAMTANQ